MSKRDEIYQEGYQDALDKLNLTHIEVEKVVESLDHLLDKINYYKQIIREIHDHFLLDKSVKCDIMSSDNDRATNLDFILQKCKSSVKEEENAEKKLQRVNL